MISIKFDDSRFFKEMMNIMDYSSGFLDGVKKGKKQLLHNIGPQVVELLKEYIDSNARVNPAMLHHVYEWYQVGSPESRLFDITYTVSNLGLSLKSTFRQSSSVKNGSYEPFYNKANIMEHGIPVTISPRRSNTLVFQQDGETIFTKGPITVENPGGQQVVNSYESTFDSFFRVYFKQSFIQSSGLKDYLERPIAYKKNLDIGKKIGRPAGESAGYRWIINAGATA